MCGTKKLTPEGGSASTQVPQRRRTSTKRSVSARKEGEEAARRSMCDTSKSSDKDPKTTRNQESHSLNNTKTENIETIHKENLPAKEEKEDIDKSITDHKHSRRKTVETKSVELQTEAAETESKLCQTEKDLELQFCQRDLEEHTRKELGVQEDRYQKQIDELTLSLAQKQEEVSKLSQTLETLKGVQDTLSSSEELQEKLSLLQQDVRDRSAQLDSLTGRRETWGACCSNIKHAFPWQAYNSSADQ
ncbi:hypothetical protein GWK47_017748 [Chionoecetes opilio]|uniref:Uncharacterized protein n=1 Tax=Chionoecetes opilio TaxID=41210 RepID=A0A8J5BYB8_CHIOP|nr:hypothetical protein GWK47_017748 [Chionoecetes opilio]